MFVFVWLFSENCFLFTKCKSGPALKFIYSYGFRICRNIKPKFFHLPCKYLHPGLKENRSVLSFYLCKNRWKLGNQWPGLPSLQFWMVLESSSSFLRGPGPNHVSAAHSCGTDKATFPISCFSPPPSPNPLYQVLVSHLAFGETLKKDSWLRGSGVGFLGLSVQTESRTPRLIVSSWGPTSQL